MPAAFKRVIVPSSSSTEICRKAAKKKERIAAKLDLLRLAPLRLCGKIFPMHENDIARIIVDAAFKIHTQLGPGLLESVYEKVLAYELTKRGLNVVIQQAIPVVYEEVHLEMGFRAGLIVNSYRRSEIGGGDRSGSCKAASHIFTIDRSTARPIDQF